MSDTFDHEADAWDSLTWGGNEEPNDHRVQRLRCKYCASTQVYWNKVDGKWRMFDEGASVPHTCSEYLEMQQAARQRKEAVKDFFEC